MTDLGITRSLVYTFRSDVHYCYLSVVGSEEDVVMVEGHAVDAFGVVLVLRTGVVG